MSGGIVNGGVGLLVLVFCFVIVGSNGQSPCNRVTDCECRGDNFRIDLTPLTIGSPTYNTSDGNDTYIYKPCSGFTHGSGGGPDSCSVVDGVSVCKAAPNSTDIGLGLPKAQFVFDSITGKYAVQYHQGNITTVVQLNCDEAGTRMQLTYDNSNATFYNLTLSSSASCIIKDEPHKKSGPSPGTVILILIAVATLVYFGGGVLYLGCFQGAQGLEVIPNLEFWLDLPMLIKDGLVFLLSGCKSPVAYDRI